MSKTIVATDHAPAAVGAYSQGVVQDGWFWTSGQVALDPATGELVGDDAPSQAHRVMQNLQAILEAGGTSFASVVRCTIYLTDMADFKAVNEVYAGYLSAPFPARACVAVTQLPLGALVEIDAIARLG